MVVPMWDEESTRAFARDNHGLIDRGTLLRHGATDDIIKTMLATGRWIRVQWGVYYLDTVERGWVGRVRSAAFAAGPHSLASHRTAAILWQLDGIRGRIVELTVPYENRAVPSGAIVHRTRRVLPATVVKRVPTTTVERTLLDLAGCVPEPVLEKSLQSALRMRLTSPDAIGFLLSEQGGPGVRGTRTLQRVLEMADDGITGSPAEVETVRLVRSAPVPTPVLQHRIRLPDGTSAYPDFSWPDRLKIVEVDGFGAHSSADSLHNDLIRQNMLMELGWEIRRFSARQVRREPRLMIDEIVRFVNG